MRVLVVNAGSSSLKVSLLDHDDRVLGSEQVDQWSDTDASGVVAGLLGRHPEPDAVGHRVVHGGTRYTRPVLVDDEVIDGLSALVDLAPLHQPRALAGIAALHTLLPGVPAVACFDTAFHAHIPPPAALYALPREWNERLGLRRFGFHGLSHAYAVRRAAQITGQSLATTRVVSAHLGAGASLAAVRAGVGVDTTMGFTPLAGLVMATRSGDVDPGLVLWLLRDAGVGLPVLADVLEHRSGLAGLSGTSGDLREVRAAAQAGQPDAATALAVYAHRLAREAAAMTVAAGGLDLLVLTGGVGEHDPGVRAGLADHLEHLGVRIDPTANDQADGDAEITAGGARVRTVVVTAREDLQIAAGVREVLAGGAASSSGAGQRPEQHVDQRGGHQQ
ncbi:MAG: acetate/propionate family kinase [Actinomycetes bacterium]